MSGRPITAPADTRSPVALRVARYAPAVKDVLRAARARLPMGAAQSDRYATAVAKAVLSSGDLRARCVEQLLALVVHQARAGELADAEAVGRTFIGVARQEYEAAHQGKVLTRAEAWLAEQEAEGVKNVAEIAYATQPTLANAIRFHEAKARHEVADEQLDDAIRRESMSTS